MMMIYVTIGLYLLGAYLLGSIPTAVWVGKAFYNIDVRAHGSGNAGATNTFRVLGKKPGFAVFLIDVLKGFAAVSLSICMVDQSLISADAAFYYKLVLGALAVVGHIYPIFAGFKGGKGVATVMGMVLGIQLVATLASFVVFLILLKITKYVSLSSMLSALCFPLMLLFVPYFQPVDQRLVIFGFVVVVLLVFTHRSNIKRLLAGTESKAKV